MKSSSKLFVAARISRREKLRQRSDGRDVFEFVDFVVVANDNGPHFEVVEDFESFVVLEFFSSVCRFLL